MDTGHKSKTSKRNVTERLQLPTRSAPYIQSPQPKLTDVQEIFLPVRLENECAERIENTQTVEYTGAAVGKMKT